MNKTIKYILLATIVIQTVSTLSPVNINLQNVYAASTSENTSVSDRQLRSISLSDGDISFSASQYEYNVKVKNSVDSIKITAKPRNTDSIVTIDGSTVDENSKDGAYKKKVDLDDGENSVKIKVEDTDGKEKVYVLNIYKGNDRQSVDSDDEEKDSGVYIKQLTLSTGSINFSKQVTKYNVNVGENIDRIDITAIPDCTENYYDNYSVRIDNELIDQDSNFKKTISLQKGENDVQILVKDENSNEKVYTINIYRGNEVQNTISNSNSKYEPIIQKNKINQWIVVDEKLKYNDQNGNPLKNQWFYDELTSKYYYFDSDGHKCTGWILDNDKWYYLSASGAMETGWIRDSGKWYYLDKSGAWIK